MLKNRNGAGNAKWIAGVCSGILILLLLNPGGYIGFFNPKTGKNETHSRKGDKRAEQRLKYKLQTETARIFRHQFLTSSREKPADKIGRRR